MKVKTLGNLVIDIENLSYSYGFIKALDGVSLKLEQGVYGLLGPNGAGKTTLMKVMLGFLLTRKGKGKILGYDIKSGIKDIRRKIGYMPESDCLLPDVDGITLVSYLGELSGMPPNEAVKRAHEVLFYVGLEEQRYRKVETYSTGMKQKIKLAQALVHDPELLFLDEPTAGLDPKGRKDMLDLIRNISENKSMSIVLSTHILPDIEFTCGSAVIIDKGKIVATELTGSISEERQDAVELKIEGDNEAFERMLSEEGLKIEKRENRILRITMPADYDKKKLFKAALEAKAGIIRYSCLKSSLSDRFVKAVGGAET
ncbi:ABC transporter ATP-binding protein [candidate division WOR-3 bacterium]|nr:ABC transporter ATP-binding protein [candidate division WOR-3 bacterium]